MNLRRKNQKNRILIIFLLLIGITVGYAVLSNTVQSNGTSKIQNPTWDIHFDHVQVTEGSVPTTNEGNKAASIDNPTTVSYAVTLPKPGDFYEFTVDAVNEGSMNAMVDVVHSTIKVGDEVKEVNELPRWLLYNISYLDI